MIDWTVEAKNRGFASGHSMLWTLYNDRGMSAVQIAEYLLVSKDSVIRGLRMFNIHVKTRGGPNNKSGRRGK